MVANTPHQPDVYMRTRKADFKEYVAEVEHLGTLPKPLVVRPKGEGRFVILDGKHGLEAANKVGLTEVQCQVCDMDDFEAMRQTYKRNLHGNCNPVLLGKMFETMMEMRSFSCRALVKEIRVSDGTVATPFATPRLPRCVTGYAPDKGYAQIAGLTVRTTGRVRGPAAALILGRGRPQSVGALGDLRLGGEPATSALRLPREFLGPKYPPEEGIIMPEEKSEKPQGGATDTQRITVKANEFLLVDRDDNVRGAFGMGPDNHPQIVFLSEKKIPWFIVNMHDNAPAMWLFDKKGRPRFEVHLDQGGDEVALRMKDGNGRVRVLIGMSEPGSCHIVLRDAEERTRAVVAYYSLEVSTTKTTEFALFDAQGDRSAVLTAVDGRPGLLKVGIVRGQIHQKTDQDSKPD
jgi:hypothetical protein